MTVADRIKARREELNLTQTELAIKAGYSNKASISQIENSGNDISLKKIKRIAKSLNTSAEYLMGWENKPEEPKEVINPNLTDEAFQIALAYEKSDERTKNAVELLLGIDFLEKSAEHPPSGSMRFA